MASLERVTQIIGESVQVPSSIDWGALEARLACPVFPSDFPSSDPGVEQIPLP
ncbi:hypothetical protein AB0L25_04910 [Spirillospora sp. NPDC052242]